MREFLSEHGAGCLRFGILILFVQLLHSASAVNRGDFKTCDQSSFCKRHRALQPGTSEYTVVADSVKFADQKLDAVLEHGRTKVQLSLTILGLTDSRLRLTVDEVNGLRPRFTASDALNGEPKEQKFKSHTPGSGSSMLLTGDGNKIVLHYRPFRIDVYSGTQNLVLSLNSQGLLKYEHFRTKKESSGSTDSQNESGFASRWLGAPFRAIGSLFASSSQDPDEVDDDHDPFPPDPGLPDDQDEKYDADEGDTLAEQQPENADGDPNESPDEEQAENTEEENEVHDEEGEGFWEETFKSHQDSKPHGSSSVGMDVSFIGFEHIFGLPEHADAFALRSTQMFVWRDGNNSRNTDPYRLYNLDVFEYELNNPMALYGSIPYVVGHSAAHTVGVLWLNAAETWVDVHSSTADKGMLRSLVDRFKSSKDVPQMDTHWISESGLIDIFIMLGPGPVDVFRQFSQLTGVSELPPLFATAYHQCRWNYNDMEDVHNVDAGFDLHDIPYDVLWLDIEHTDGKRYFTWDRNKFSDPKKMIGELAAKSRKIVTIIDPHIKKDDGYKVYKEAKDRNYFVKDRHGNDLDGWCWPGSSAYLDFLDPVVRDYWANHFKFSEYEGSTETLFVWNDMNEPSVFNGPEITMHKDCKHFGGWEHRDVHNMYGFYHHASTHKGLLERSEGRLRPFVLTRAFFAGSQRYSAVWTGDNMAQWSHLEISIPMLLSLSVAGIPFVGADVGGFFHNPDEELLVRWYQMGAFSPFFRAHAHLDARRREPWLFSEETKNNIRDAIRYRYRLLPYWYTVFREHTENGLPIMRPMWLEFPEDATAFDEDRQFFIGNALLVKPVMKAGERQTSTYLPGEGSVWYEFDNYKAHPGPGASWKDTPLNTIAVYQRGGTVVATRERVRRASPLMMHDPITLYVALSLQGDRANGTLYLDDGATYSYTQGQFLYRYFEWRKEAQVGSLTSKNYNKTGRLQLDDVWIEKIVLLGVRFWPQSVHLFYEDYNSHDLTFDFDRETMSLTIRKPGMLIGKDWRIDVHG